MNLKRTWMLSVGLLLVFGTLGCREKPGPVAEPEPVVEVEAVAEPVAEEAKQSPPRAGGRARCGYRCNREAGRLGPV